MNIPKLRSDNSGNPNSRGLQPGLTDNSVGRRIIEALGPKSRSWLAKTAELPESTIGDAIKRGPSRSDVAVRIARALGVTLDWLLVGQAGTAPLMPADDAGWVDVPEYDLREMTEASLGQPARVTPVREDWLYTTFRARSGLWLTRLLSDYHPAGLAEGTLVICQMVSRDELAEGHVCLWRVQDTVVVGRFSVLPDAAIVQGRIGPQVDGRLLAPFVDPSLGISQGDLLVPPSAIAVGEAGRYHLIGRILGVMIRPI